MSKCLQRGVEAILNKGSMKMELQTLSVEVANRCVDMDVELQVKWIPRNENVEADMLSREIDADDWGVSQTFYNFIDHIWGPHSVDRFADENNAKLNVFNSKYWCPNTSQVDAFSLSWGNDNNWL